MALTAVIALLITPAAMGMAEFPTSEGNGDAAPKTEPVPLIMSRTAVGGDIVSQTTTHEWDVDGTIHIPLRAERKLSFCV